MIDELTFFRKKGIECSFEIQKSAHSTFNVMMMMAMGNRSSNKGCSTKKLLESDLENRASN